VRTTGSGTMSGVIVETEGYTQDDPASHSFGGMSSRNRQMFMKGGIAYVYLIYGIHHCLNVVSGPEGSGEAVLIRSLRPVDGVRQMRENRGRGSDADLCRGPGRLCAAMDVDLSLNGESYIHGGSLQLWIPKMMDGRPLLETPRTGVTKGSDLRRRFVLKDSEWVSGSRFNPVRR